MARQRRVSARPSPRAGFRDRHGRGLRSSVAGPHLPVLRTRTERFDQIVGETVDTLRGVWPVELSGVRFEVAAMPSDGGGGAIDRWRVHPRERRVVLYRLPIERLGHLHVDDEAHQRMHIEACVLRAVGELIGRDPWDLAPDRFRHH